MEKLSDQIRKAIDQSGVSRYRISQLTGIDQGALSKFMAHKGGLSVASLDDVAELLGLELRKTRKEQ